MEHRKSTGMPGWRYIEKILSLKQPSVSKAGDEGKSKKDCPFCAGEGKAWIWSFKLGDHWEDCSDCMTPKNQPQPNSEEVK